MGGRIRRLRSAARSHWDGRRGWSARRRPDRHDHEPAGLLGPVLPPAVAGSDAAQDPVRMELALTLQADGRLVRLLLRFRASRHLRRRRPVLRSARGRRGHRKAQVHHRRLPGLPAVGAAGDYVDGPLGAAARVRAVEAPAPVVVPGGGLRRDPLRLAGKGGSPSADDVWRHTRRALRGSHFRASSVAIKPGEPACSARRGCDHRTVSAAAGG